MCPRLRLRLRIRSAGASAGRASRGCGRTLNLARDEAAVEMIDVGTTVFGRLVMANRTCTILRVSFCTLNPG